jgi:flagellar export protein FliJ
VNQARHRRVKRLLELRAKELERRVADLSAARQAEMIALECYNARRALTMSAIVTREAWARRGTTIDEWKDVEHWVAEAKKRESAARGAVSDANRAVGEARARVEAARLEQEKIERLLERLAVEVRTDESRADQKTTDESAAARFLRSRGSGA